MHHRHTLPDSRVFLATDTPFFVGKTTRQELKIPHGQASPKSQVLQTVRCLAAIREVPLGIPKQAGAKCPYFPHWLPSNHFPPENAPLYPRTKSQPAQADNQRASELSRPPVFKRGHGNDCDRIPTACPKSFSSHSPIRVA